MDFTSIIVCKLSRERTQWCKGDDSKIGLKMNSNQVSDCFNTSIKQMRQALANRN